MGSNKLNGMILDTIELEESQRVKQRGEDLGKRIVEAIKKARRESARTRQAAARVLGMSDLGGCREFIRATIAGDPRKEPDRMKWAAEVGTAVGDHVETILSKEGFDVQDTVTLTLPRTGISVTGHLDEVDVTTGDLADNKTVNGLADVRNEGPSDKNVVQISGYLVAAVQGGRLGTDAVGHLVYYDRSGAESEPFVWSISYEMALQVLDWAEERLLDVQHALATGTRNDRNGRLMTDEPESWCKAIGCPFYEACWAGYEPTGKITHERELDAVRRAVKARDDENDAKARRAAARADLAGVEGVTPDGTVVRWTLTTAPSGYVSERLDLRVKK